jgi:poly-gamma-glutamate system protein
MKKLYIKSNLVTAILTVLSITGFVIVENTMTYVKQNYFDEKLQAANMTMAAVEFLKNDRMENVYFIDKLNDPNETGIIGQKYSQITSEEGSLPIKLSTTNPNFAAFLVELLKQAGIHKDDHVVVCMTGSFPALNIATLSAMEVLKVKPLIIISITSSSWGANDPDFTFPDMIRTLQKASYFKDFEFTYASPGGLEDMGMSLSKKGRELVDSAGARNNFVMIRTGNLSGNIAERMKIIDTFSETGSIKAFINIGGGIASLGTFKNGEKIPSGLTKNMRVNTIPDKSGVLYEMAKRNVPIINLNNLGKLMKEYDLPENPIPLPQPGEGELYYIYKYDMKIVLIVTTCLLIIIAIFVYIDRKNHKLGNDIISDEIQI